MGTKFLLIVLILIVALFVVFVWGAVKHSNERKNNAGQDPTLSALNGLLAPFGPKLKTTQLQPALATFNLQTQAEYDVQVSEDSDHKFRQAKFVVQPKKACANAVYTPSGNNIPYALKRPQNSDDSQDANEFTFTILEGGGKLTITRSRSYPIGPCEVQLQ
jgi:hypothetical protein